jgi:uncharacterized protein (TIGR03086 family)
MAIVGCEEESMSSAYDSVILLSRALDQAGDVLALVHDDQLAQPTPCRDWDVGRLIAHMVAAPHHLLEMSRGDHPDWSKEPAPATGEWAADFRSAADDLIHFWHQAGEAADPSKIDWQTAEIAVHTWDLARATGHDLRLDPDVAERGLAFMSSALTPENRGDAFGEEVSVPEDAPAYDRLAAFAGRSLG